MLGPVSFFMWSFFPDWSHAQNHANSSTHSCPVWWPADPLAAGCSYGPTIKLFSQSKLRDKRLAILILIIVISCFCLHNFFDPFQRMHEYAVMLTCFCSMISHMTRLSHKPSTMTYQKQVGETIPNERSMIEFTRCNIVCMYVCMYGNVM